LSIPGSILHAEQQSKEKPVKVDTLKEETKSYQSDEERYSNPQLDKNNVTQALNAIIADYRIAHKNMEVSVLMQPFEVEEERVHFQLSSDLQQDIFSKCKPELTGLLRKKLQHVRLDVTYEIVEEANESSKNLYTSTDKLHYLLEKSPALKELQKRFGLEADF
jgi:DNA polymerase-3 subunit gamma/tau